MLAETFEERLQKLTKVYCDAFDAYFKSLLKGRPMLGTDGTDPEFDKFHNKVIDKQNKNGCGIRDFEEQIHKIRSAIQEYFKSFNPIKRYLGKEQNYDRPKTAWRQNT